MARTKAAALRAKEAEARRLALAAKSKNGVFSHSYMVSNFSRGLTAPKVVDGMRVPCRVLPGTQALREIRQFQASTERLIKHAPFKRLVNQILEEMVRGAPFKIKTEAVLALQDAAEEHVVEFLDRARRAAVHAGRVTVMPRDLDLAKRIAKQPDGHRPV